MCFGPLTNLSHFNDRTFYLKRMQKVKRWAKLQIPRKTCILYSVDACFDGLISCAAFLQQFKRWIYFEFNFKKNIYILSIRKTSPYGTPRMLIPLGVHVPGFRIHSKNIPSVNELISLVDRSYYNQPSNSTCDIDIFPFRF